jgi:hypothetical protein
MTLIEFLAARDNPASVIARLELAEYRDWLLMFTAVDGKTIVPIIGQAQARVEHDLMMTRIVVTQGDDSSGARRFNLEKRDVPLLATPVAAAPAPGTATTARRAATEPASATAVAPAGGGGAWDKFVQLLSPEAKLLIHPGLAVLAIEEPPPVPAIPPPSTAEDGLALVEITAASARIVAQATGVLDLPSPPPILLDGLIIDLQRQLDNFAMQAQMVSRRTELAAFPVKLEAVIAEIEYLMRRAGTLRSQLIAAPSVHRPAPTARPAVAASPRAVKQSAAMWEQLTNFSPRSDAGGKPTPTRAAPDYAAQVAAAASTAAAKAKAHAAAMKAQKDQFDEWQAAHKRQQDAFDKTNAEWLAGFKKR